MVNIWLMMVHNNLVGGFSPPLCKIMEWKSVGIMKFPTYGKIKLLHFEWSPPWHLYIFLLANLLAFYLTYLLAFYLAFYLANLLTFYLAYLLAFYLTFYLAYLLTFFLAFYLAYLLTFYLAYLLAFYLTYLLAFYLAYLLAFYLTVYLAYLLTFFLAFYLAYLLAFYLAYLLTFYLTSFLTFFPLRSGSAHCDLEVAVEVRQCPLRSGSRGWRPAVPTAIWKSRLRSGSAHWDLELAVEVRQCPLGSGARGGGPAVPTGIWTARRRRRARRRRMRRRRMRRRRRRRTALIKSNNPHLAGGENVPNHQPVYIYMNKHHCSWCDTKYACYDEYHNRFQRQEFTSQKYWSNLEIQLPLPTIIPGYSWDVVTCGCYHSSARLQWSGAQVGLALLI